MKMKLIAVLGVLALGALVPMMSASAQQESLAPDHMDVRVETQAACNADGTQSATFLITNQSSENTGTITVLHSTIGPLTGAAVGDVLAPGASESVSLSTNGDQTGTVHLYVEMTWTPNVNEPPIVESGGDDIVFNGGCVAVAPVTVPGPTVYVPVPAPVAGAVVAAAHFTG